MNTSHQNAANTFSGKMNSDFDYRNVEQTDFIYALNIRSQFGSTLGARENIQGNVLVSNTLPSGLNTVVGSVEDKQGGTLLYFVYNSLGNHSIYRFYPEEQTVNNDKGIIRLVIQSSVLNFQLNSKIHSATVLDNYLIWPDSTSNPPRYLDLDKAIMDTKNELTYKLLLDSTSFVNTKAFYLSVTAVDGTVIEAATLAYTADATDWEAQVDALITGIDALAFDVTVTKRSSNKIEFTSDGSERCEITVDSGAEILWVEVNHYPETILDYHINLIKPVPKCAPVAKFTKSGLTSSNLYGFTFQFAYRYLFVDNSRSAFSPISQIPTALDSFGRYDKDYDELLIEINDANLSDEGYLNLIKGIELVVRYDDRGIFRRVGYYERSEMSLNNIEISFTNNGVYNVIGSDEDGTPDIQVFKQFESIPKFAETAVMLSDDKGRSRLILGGNTEGYDVDIIPDVAIVVGTQAAFGGSSPDPQYNRKFLKNDGVYNWGIVYEDGYNRKSAVLPIGSSKRNYTIPAYAPEIDIRISHLPPAWATHYRIVRTRNQYHEEYVQTNATIRYVKISETTSQPEFLEYGDTDITHYEFTLSPNTSKEQEEDVVYMFHKINKMLSVNPSEKHFLKLLFDGTDINSPVSLFDYPIVGYDDSFYNSTEGLKLYVEHDPNYIPDIGYFPLNADRIKWGIQVYKRREVLDEFYYETGHCYDITGGYHMGEEQDQTGGQYAGIVFTGGDTYSGLLPNFIGRITNQGFFEKPYLFLDFADTENEDIGRANIEDDNAREIFFSNGFRVSDLYISDSSVNGVPNFRSGNRSFVDKMFGDLTRLVLARDVMLAICSFKIQPFYVGKAELIDLRANTLLAGSEELLKQGQESIRDIGSSNGESIISEDGRVYGWDSYKRLWWRYAQNGVESLSRDYLNHKKFRELGEDIAQYGGTFVYAGFERNYRTLCMTFEGITNSNGVVPPQTWAFEDSPLTGYIGEQSFIPDYYGRVGSHFVSFKDGGLWLHDYDHADYCNFYGVQYGMKIKYAIHQPSMATKLFWNLRLQTDKKFLAAIEVYHGSKKMRSRLKSNKWTRYEGTYWADFLRNMDDTSFNNIAARPERETKALLLGEPLRGDVMLIELTATDASVRNVLYRSDVEFTVSHDTKVK